METNTPPSPAGLPRRDFIKKTASAAAVVAATPFLKTPVYGADTAPSANVTGANNRIAVAVIGTGTGIGLNHFVGMLDHATQNNIVVAAGCDLFKKRRVWMAGEKVKFSTYENNKEVANTLKEADVYSDHRKLLERKDIDAVLIATHDIWHAQITKDALQAGKHVYCEKPLTRYLDEAFTVYDAVKSSGKVFQVGSQGCTAGAYHKCAELIKAGKIGTPVWAQAWYSRNSKGGEWNYAIDRESTAENIEWERWLGTVKNRPAFDPEYFTCWRKYYQYCAGPLGDLAPHRLHPVMLATGNPQFPVRVCSISSKPVGIDKGDPDNQHPTRDTPEHAQLLAEFPGGFMIMVTCCTVNAETPGLSIFGHKANLNIDATGGKVDLKPQSTFGDDIDPEYFANMQPEDIRAHEKNWFDCIRSGKTPNADIELAIRVQTVISLAEMSDRLKITCLFDEKTRKISDASGKEIAPITYGTLPLS
jgi:predicted dehydrogenase